MIVEKLDGTIGVDSEPGKGTRFHFSIPVVHRDGSKNDEQLCAAPGRDDGKSWVLLVAEDSDTNFRLIEAVLSRPLQPRACPYGSRGRGTCSGRYSPMPC